MSGKRHLSSRITHVETLIGSRLGVLLTATSLVSFGCEDETRCWEDGTCPVAPSHQADGGVDAAAMTEDDPTLNPSAPTASGIADAATSGGESRPSGDGGESRPSWDSGESGYSGDSGEARPSWDGGETIATSTSASDAIDAGSHCSGDDQCPNMCVQGICQACDPSDHRGCEDAEAGPRCRAFEDGNACVQCIPGDTPPEHVEACGINGRGQAVFECVSGVWQTTACTDPDVCSDGEVQVGGTVCGPNDGGHYLTECKSGQWADDTGSCIDDDQCVNGTRRDSTTECGFSGYLEQQCVNGAWLTQSNRCNECKRKYFVSDPYFENSLSVRNNIPANPVDPESVKYMVTLNLSFSSIVDATGIQCFTSLEELDLGKNQLSDLTPLASLTQLRRLNLSYNVLEHASLAQLGGLTELRSLGLEGAGLTSLDGLETLTLLEELRAPANNIRDVTPLLPLTELQLVALHSNYDLDCESAAFASLVARVPDLSSDCE